MRISICTLITIVCLTSTLAGQTATRPNIVLIMCDDMGFSDIGCYGGDVLTPPWQPRSRLRKTRGSSEFPQLLCVTLGKLRF